MFEFLVLMLIAVGFVAVPVWRGLPFRDLATRGVEATATVTYKHYRRKRLGFRYTGPDGMEYQRYATLAIGEYSKYQEGDPFPIVLLPDKPGVSAPKGLVEAARQALEKRKG